MLCDHCETEKSSLIHVENHVTFGSSNVCDECLTKNDYSMLINGFDPGLIVVQDKFITNRYNSFHIPINHIENSRFKFNIYHIPNHEFFFVKGKRGDINRFRVRIKK